MSSPKAKVFVEGIAEKYAGFIARNPWKVVVGMVLIQVMFGLSLLTRTLNNDIKELYTPRNGETDENIRRLLPVFPDLSANKFSSIRSVKKPLFADVIIARPNGYNGTVDISDEDVKLVLETVANVTIPAHYRTADLFDVCAKFNQRCVITVSENVNVKLFEPHFNVDSKFELKLRQKTVTSYFLKSSTYPVKLRFYLRQDIAAFHEDSVSWQHSFLREMKKWKNENITLFYSHSESHLEEVGNDTFPDIRIFSLAVGIFITYCGFLLSGGDCVAKRMNIGRVAVLVVPFSVLGAWGFLSGIGMTFTNIVGLMPLFVVFHEVNMGMAMLSGVANNLGETNGVKRVVKAVKEVAVPSLVLQFVHIIPFVSAIWSRYLVMETFAVYTVTTMFFNFITHISFFIGCLTIHELRIDANRHSCTCKVVKPRDDPENEGRNCCFLCCCTGKRPSSREQLDSFLERVPKTLFSRMMLVRPVQIFLILSLLTCLGASVWKTIDTRIDTIQETDVISKSYFRQYFEKDREYFQTLNVFSFVVSSRDMVFTQNDGIEDLLSIYGSLNRLPIMRSNATEPLFWLSEFHFPGRGYSSEAEFYKLVKLFLEKEPKFRPDIVWNGNDEAIIGFRFYAIADTLQTSKDMIAAKTLVDDFVHEAFENLDDIYGVNVQVHTPSLWLTDAFKRPMYEVIIFAGVQIAVLSLALLLFGNSIFACVHVLFWHSSCVFMVLGCLVVIGVTVNIVSAIDITVGLCFCSEVLFYYLYTFLYSEGTNNGARMYNVMQKTMPIIYNTTFGILCGLPILLLTKSYVFQTVMKVLGASVMVAWVHSFAFLAPTLALVGIGKAYLLPSAIEKSFKVDISMVSNGDTTIIASAMENESEEQVNKGFENDETGPSQPEFTKL